MNVLTLNVQEFRITRARRADVAVIVALLREDVLGARREDESLDAYLRAFDAIDRDDNQFLMAVRDARDEVVGTMQLTLIPGLSRGGATRLQIEAVRIAVTTRGAGLGSALFRWAEQFGRERGATMAQLTTDKQRVDARRFYERLGYVATHEGMKLSL